MSTPELLPRKQPRQARATAMVDIILLAATRVLTTESLAGFNTNRVADVAGVSIGSLYQYFPNKAALVAALIERDQSALADALELCAQKGRDRSLKTQLGSLVDIAIAHQFGNPVYAAALDHEEKRLPLDAVLGTAQQRMVAALQNVLQGHSSLLSKALTPHAAMDCLILTKALVESHTSPARAALASLKARVLQALEGYLLHDNSIVI
jgi:AcrR family transcriptional regulator